jgi:hypothetical protein
MKLKTVVILIILLALLGLAAYFTQNRDTRVKTGAMGEKLFKTLPLEKLARITLKSSEGTVHLKKKQGLWVVEDQFDFPADFSLITELITKLVNAKTGRSFEASREAVLRLGLASPEETTLPKENTGIQIELRDGEDNLNLQVTLGKTREATAGAGGHYLMVHPTPVIHLVDENFSSTGKTSLDWIRKTLFNLKAESIEKILCFASDGSSVYTLLRPDKNQWPVLTGAQEGILLNQSKLDDVLTPLSPLDILGVMGAKGSLDLSRMEFTRIFDYHLYDKTIIRIIPGKTTFSGEDVHVVQAKVLQFSPEPGEESLNPEDPLYQRMDQWVYVVPPWKYKRFIGQAEDLFEKE